MTGYSVDVPWVEPREEARALASDAWVRFVAPVEGSAEERARLGWDALRAAPSAPDADVVIASGGWAGFTRATARQWCWNLFQYEPQGFSMPVPTVSLPGVKEWLGGGVPDVRGYAARARALEAQGVTPVAHREAKDAEGKKTFTQRDVTITYTKEPPTRP